MLHKWKKLGLALLASSAVFLASCAPNPQQSEGSLVNGDEITLSYVAWDDLIASTNVIGTVLQDLGYDVTLTNLDNAVMWQSVATGEADAMVSAWLPTTHGAQYEEYGDQMEHVGTNLEGAQNAITVPSYMEDVNSIEDLSDQADQTITGVEAGAGIMTAAQDTMQAYDNLSDWSLATSSAGAMTTELESAIADQEEIVVTGWQPHWKFLEYDLKMLEDPEGTMGGEETVNTFVRQGLSEDHPVAHSVLSNFHWETEDIESVMYDIAEGTPPEEAARTWVDENQDLVSEWTAGAEEIAASQSSE